MDNDAKKEILSAINAFSTAVDERFEEVATKSDLGKSNHDLKAYIDRKMAEYHSDVFKRMEKEFQEDRQFQKKVIELFQAHQIGTAEDLAYLKGLAKS